MRGVTLKRREGEEKEEKKEGERGGKGILFFLSPESINYHMLF